MQKYYSSFILNKTLASSWHVVLVNSLVKSTNSDGFKSTVVGVFKFENKFFILDSNRGVEISFEVNNQQVEKLKFVSGNKVVYAKFKNENIYFDRQFYNEVGLLPVAVAGAAVLKVVLKDEKIKHLFKELENGTQYCYTNLGRDAVCDGIGYSSVLAADNGLLLNIVNIVNPNTISGVPSITVINRRKKYVLDEDNFKKISLDKGGKNAVEGELKTSYVVTDANLNANVFVDDESVNDVYVVKDKKITRLFKTKDGTLNTSHSGQDIVPFVTATKLLHLLEQDKYVTAIFKDLDKHLDHCSQYCPNRDCFLELNEAFDMRA